MKLPKAWLCVLAAAMLASGSSCTRLRSFESVRASLPEDQFVSVDGQWVHFEQAGQGEALILIHGFGASTYAWREVLPRLSPSHRVLAVDLNGFGYTQRPNESAAYSIDGQAQLVVGVMDALGIDRAHVAGHSYGAGVALHMAVTQKDRVGKLILVDGGGLGGGTGGPTIPAFLKPFLLCYVKRFGLRRGFIYSGLTSAAYRDDFVTDEVVGEYLRRLEVEGLEDAFYGLTARRAGIRIEPTSIIAPVLIVWGIHDRTIPLSVGESLHDNLPTAELVVLSESGHMPMEEEPERFSEIVAEFLLRN